MRRSEPFRNATHEYPNSDDANTGTQTAAQSSVSFYWLLFSRFVLSLENEVFVVSSSNSFSIFDDDSFNACEQLGTLSAHSVIVVGDIDVSARHTNTSGLRLIYSFPGIYTMNLNFELANAKRRFEWNRYLVALQSASRLGQAVSRSRQTSTQLETTANLLQTFRPLKCLMRFCFDQLPLASRQASHQLRSSQIKQFQRTRFTNHKRIFFFNSIVLKWLMKLSYRLLGFICAAKQVKRNQMTQNKHTKNVFSPCWNTIRKNYDENNCNLWCRAAEIRLDIETNLNASK